MWAQVLVILIFAAVVLTWALEPVMNTVLLCSSFAWNLLPRSAKLATYAFLAYALLAVPSVTAGIATARDGALMLALALSGVVMIWFTAFA